jgi:RHS repeat-associated protein
MGNKTLSVTNFVTSMSTYDGDGVRVQATVAGVTTLYAGAYEKDVTNNIVRKYYAGYAMRENGNLRYLLKDHLGSTHKTVTNNGSVTSTTLYKAWGEVRYQSGTLPTDKTYTGQRTHTDDFGLMFYNARFYDPSLGRFASADTVIPGAGNPAAWDRYAGMLNNPVKFSDPTGHIANIPCSPHRPCEPSTPYRPPTPGPSVSEFVQATSGYGQPTAYDPYADVLAASFDPYFGPYYDQELEPDIHQAILDQDHAAKVAYYDLGTDLNKLHQGLNPLTQDDLDLILNRMGSEFDSGTFIMGNLSHREFHIFLIIVGEKLNIPDFASHYMQYESTYLAALMNAHEEELAYAQQFIRENYWAHSEEERKTIDLLEKLKGASGGSTAVNRGKETEP